MYAVGGCDESNFRLNSVERYNPLTNTWSFTAPMTTCRSSPSVLTCRVLYVIGGVSYVGMSLNTGEYLDPVTNTWRPIASMHYKRASASGAATNGKIYVIGKSLKCKISCRGLKRTFKGHCVFPKNIHTPLTEGFFGLNTRPSGNSSFISYFPLKMLAFETPLPLGISN